MLLAFPILLWFFGTFFLFGDIGKWIDDYAAHVRDPVSGSFAWSDLLRSHWWFVWRPIHVQLVFALQTLLWNHDWLNHLFSALMHALACLSLWHFLRQCDLRPLVCVCAAIIMLAAPQAFEAIFWPATVSTTIACAAYFFAARIVVRFAQRRHRPGAIPALGILGFVIPSLYEQPAAALAALPILYIAAAWPLRTPTGAPAFAAHARRCVRLLTPCAIGLLIYLAAFLITARRDEMARESQFAAIEFLWPRTHYLLRTLGYMLNPFQSLGELSTMGLRTLKASAIGLTVASALFGLAALAWILIWQTKPAIAGAGQPAGETQSRRTQPVILLLFALAAMACALLPIVAIAGAGLSSRLTYFPLACAILIAALLADLLLTACAKWGGVKGESSPSYTSMSLALQVATIALAAHGVLALIGAQSFYQQRSRHDQAQVAALRALLPNPVPGTLFIPLRVEIDPRDPSADKLRNSFGSIWSSPWAINTWIKHAYARTDVHAACIYPHNQATAILRMSDPVVVAWSHYCWNLPTPRFELFCPEFPLAQVVPFAVDAEGRVTLIERLSVGDLDGTQRTFEFPQVRAAPIDPSARTTMNLALPLDTGGAWLEEWRWPHKDNDETKFLRMSNWGASERAVRMHPFLKGFKLADGDTHEMTLVLPPSADPRRFLFHATFAEDTIDISCRGDGVEFVWSLDDGPALASLALDPKAIRDQRHWRRAEVVIPPTDRPRTLRVRCLPGPAGNTSCDRAVITCGVELGRRTPGPLGAPVPMPKLGSRPR